MIRSALIAMLLAAPAYALPPTVDVAQTEGYHPRSPDEPAGSVGCSIVAATAGLLVHGLGHYCAGDTDTALTLLLAEVVGVGLYLGAAALDASTQGDGPSGGTRRTLAHAGALLFFASWGADILGSYQGAEPLDPLSIRAKQRTLGLAYRFTDDPLTPFNHHLVTHLNIDRGLFYLRPSVDIEAQLEVWQVAMDLGVRLFRGENPHNQFLVGARYRRQAVRQYGYATEATTAYFGWQIELGQIMRGLRNVYLFNRTGYGLIGHQFSNSLGSAPDIGAPKVFYDSWLMLETGIAVNTGVRTTLTVTFVEDPTRDIAPAEADDELIEIGLLHRQRDDLNIAFLLTKGDGWGVWLGLGYGL